ncbi:uncharacterized protein LOC123539007 [Mercenaria mercenaria]|uniref:uncharacterized protein LOC123539007 n=1 Tax=Mercenaria mercenaria TaxID=6596 RepID=UPI00234EB139|nr:uncharacterized protein LOC123539007 [Mercenaria mercenaria]
MDVLTKPVTIVFLICIFCMNGLSVPFLEIAGKGFDIYDLTKNVLETLGILDEESPVEKEELDSLLNEIDERINSAKYDINTNILIQSRLQIVDDAVIIFRSLLIDLENILQPQTAENRMKCKNTFLSRFENEDAITHIRFLPDLLSYQIPGTSAPLADLFADLTRCNMTALEEFKWYYRKLVSDGMALQMTQLQLVQSPLLNKTLERWVKRNEDLERTFVTRTNACMNKFAIYADEDIRLATDAQLLWKSNNMRYAWKINDVIFLKPFGTFQFLYTKSVGKELFFSRGRSNKIVIFTEKNDTCSQNATLENAKSALKSAIISDRDENAAKHVGIAAENVFREQGYIIRALLVYFNGEEFAEENVIVDNASSVIQISIDKVQLTYCSSWGVKCALDPGGAFGALKNVEGSMKVYAYVAKDDGILHVKEREYKTNGANGVRATFLILFCYLSLRLITITSE